MKFFDKTNDRSQNEMFLQVNDSIIQDQKQVANVFNEYFTSVAQSLIDIFGKLITAFSDYLKDPVANSFMTSPITESEVLDQLSNLDISKVAGAYDNPVKRIKLIQIEIYKPPTT